MVERLSLKTLFEQYHNIDMPIKTVFRVDWEFLTAEDIERLEIPKEDIRESFKALKIRGGFLRELKEKREDLYDALTEALKGYGFKIGDDFYIRLEDMPLFFKAFFYQLL